MTWSPLPSSHFFHPGNACSAIGNWFGPITIIIARAAQKPLALVRPVYLIGTSMIKMRDCFRVSRVNELTSSTPKASLLFKSVPSTVI